MKSSAIPLLAAALTTTVTASSGSGSDHKERCYSSLSGGEFGTHGSTSTFDQITHLSCRKQCTVAAFEYSALSGTICTCGAGLPAESNLLSDTKLCDQPCLGSSSEVCGGKNESAWTVIKTNPDGPVGENIQSLFPDITPATASGLQGPSVTLPPTSGPAGGNDPNAFSCFKSLKSGNFQNTLATYEFNSYGYCRDGCKHAAFEWAAVQGDECICGSKLPGTEDEVGKGFCDTPCPGFASQMCGGKDAWAVVWTKVEDGAGSNATISTSSSIQPPGPTGTGTAPSVPVAAAGAQGVWMGGVAAALGLGVVYNLF